MVQLTSEEINLILVSLGGIVLILGLLSGWLKERLWLSDPIVALVLGILLGPAVLNWLNLSRWGNSEGILEQGARIAIAIQVMGVALRLPPGYPRENRKTIGALLGLVMPSMWLVSGLLVWWISDLSFLASLMTGAVLAPTDPVIATSIVTGKVAKRNLPDRLRHAISAESAANDGLGYPFVLLPVLMLTLPRGEAIGHWLTRTLLWEVGGAIVLGALLGLAAGKLLKLAERKHTLDKPSFLAYTVALSLFVLGALKLIGSDGILGVFAAGIAFDQVVDAGDRAREEGVQEAIDRFFTLYIFVLLGLALPWGDWANLGWRGIVLALLILLFRRLPAMLLLRPWLGQIRRPMDALFAGWFGPIGVAAIFYSFLCLRRTGMNEPWMIGSLVICTSIVVHGFTAVPLAQLYRRETGYTSELEGREEQEPNGNDLQPAHPHQADQG